ncbi:MAG: SRPBCC domain-containing protein [Acidobacteriota bacterium]
MHPVVEHSTYIAASPTDVYDALATGQGLDGWFTSGAEVDAREGGKIRLRWRNFGVDGIDAEDGGPVLEAEPGRVFSFQWFPAGEGSASTVRFVLQPFADGTRVDVTESGFDAAAEKSLEAAMMCAVGWGEALTLLKYHLEAPAAFRHPCAWKPKPETASA